MKDWVYRGFLGLIDCDPHCEKFFTPVIAKIARSIDEPEKREKALKAILKYFYSLLIGESSAFSLGKESFSFVAGHSYEYTYCHFTEQTCGPVAYGPRKPFQVFIVGDSPSIQEIRNKLNFVGDFGKLLFECLLPFLEDIPPYEIYITNICKCYVTQQKDKNELLRRFQPLLSLELALAKPDIIITIGCTPLRFFTRRKLADVINEHFIHEIFTIQDDGSLEIKKVKVFAAPLTALQENIHLLTFKNCMSNALCNYLSREFLHAASFNFKIIEQPQQLEEIVEDILQAAKEEGLQRVAVDLEWSGGKPFSKKAKILAIGFAWKDTAYVIPVREKTLEEQKIFGKTFGKLFEPNNGVQILGYNFMADALWLDLLGIDCIPKYLNGVMREKDENYDGIFDLLVALHAFDESGVVNLEEAAKLYLNWKPWSGEVEKFKTKDYGAIPDEILLPYCAEDCFVLLKLFPVFASYLHDDGKTGPCWRPYFLLLKAIPAYIEMARVGIKVDLDLLYKMIDVFNRAKSRLEQQIREATGFPAFNINSIYHKIAVLFGQDYLTGKSNPQISFCATLTPLKTTKGTVWLESLKGKETPATDLETLLYLSNKHPVAKLLYYAQIVNKLTTSILRPLVLSSNSEVVQAEGLLKFIEDDGRIHPLYYPYLETRRSSSSEPNMQNLPNSEKEEIYKQILGDDYPGPIRSIFISDPDESFVSVDYVGAELLMLGLISGDENLIRDYHLTLLPDDHPDKLDIHSMVAVHAFKLNCPPSKAGLKSIGKEYLRLAAKRIIFGLNYGRGAESCWRQLTSQGVDVTLEEINGIINYIYTRYPKVKQFQEAIRARVRHPGWIRNIFGSCRRFAVSRVRERLDEKEREALNFGCQSGVADAISLALYNAMVHPSKKDLNYRCVLQNHDAIVFLVPDKNVETFVSEVIPEIMQKRVPLRKIDLDGNPVDDKVYYFGVSTEVSKRLPA